MKKTWIALFSMLMLALVLAACGGGGDNGNDTGTNNDNGAATEDKNEDGNGDVGGNAAADYDADEASATFQQNCSSCHGGNLEGASGPALDAVGSKYSKDEILDIIENGKGSGMPAGLIQGDEAENVAAWLADKK